MTWTVVSSISKVRMYFNRLLNRTHVLLSAIVALTDTLWPISQLLTGLARQAIVSTKIAEARWHANRKISFLMKMSLPK